MRKILSSGISTLTIHLKQVIHLFIFFLLTSCGQTTPEQTTMLVSDTTITKNKTTAKPNVTVNQKKNPIDFLPKGYIVFEKINGDLNKDELEDNVLIIKGTDKSKIITDEYRGQLDRNRRGIIVLFNKKGHYELVLNNYDCFYSENEDGGVYYAPELSIEIKKGNLYIIYNHGRYGYWRYTFRFQNSDFELIGYDDSNNFGSVVNNVTSINFSTKEKLVKVNTNENADSGEEIFKTTKKKVSIDSLIKLSEIKDFSELDMTIF